MFRFSAQLVPLGLVPDVEFLCVKFSLNALNVLYFYILLCLPGLLVLIPIENSIFDSKELPIGLHLDGFCE